MKPKKILLTGASGFFGRQTQPILEARYGAERIVGVNSSNYDLMDLDAVERMFDDIVPDTVVHYAVYSGGIGSNCAYPGDYYYRNTILTAHVFEVAARRNIKKLVYPIAGCCYPADAVSPIDEDQLWKGYPQAESACYSTAKLMGLVAARSYAQQHGLNATVIIPGNMYGEYDNFNSFDSHVVPAMIRRYYEAQLKGIDRVEMWGSGTPQRDFVYAGDVAAIIPFFIESFDDIGPINLSTSSRTSIRELAETIAELVGFEGEITWDTTKPDGQMIKIFSTERLKNLGPSCDTSLHEGLQRTIDWFSAHYGDRSDGLRL